MQLREGSSGQPQPAAFLQQNWQLPRPAFGAADFIEYLDQAPLLTLCQPGERRHFDVGFSHGHRCR